MSDLTQGQFFEAIRQINERIDQRHSSLRDTIEERFDKLDRKLDNHEADDRKVADRVLIIETARQNESGAAGKALEDAKTIAGRRHAYFSMLIALGVTGVFEAMKLWWTGKP